MAALGKTNTLVINRFVDFGAFLEGGEDLGEILLPQKCVPTGAVAGDSVEVFIYRDSEDRLIATTDEPYAEVCECAHLEAVQVSNVGAFLDWGLEKDLFVPFAEQTRKMRVGQKYVVYVYVDNTDRLAGTTKLDKFLSTTPTNLKTGDQVELMIVRPTDLGWEAAIDDEALGMIFENDALVQLKPGMRKTGYIKNVRAEDGKIDLMLQPPASPEARGDLASQIMDYLRASGGTLRITDKSSPKEIFDTFGVSKRAYKAAIGKLYRERRIVLKDRRVELPSD